MMPKVEAICDFHTQTGHGDGMLIGGHGTMLQRVPLDLHLLMGENIGTYAFTMAWIPPSSSMPPPSPWYVPAYAASCICDACAFPI